MKKFIVLAALLLFPLTASAEKVIFVTEDYPPYVYEENGRATGFDSDTIREVCKRLGIEPKFRFLPWKRALSQVKRGTAHAIYSLMRTDERSEFLYYPSEILCVDKNVIFGRKGSGIKVLCLDDLKEITLGVVVEYSYGPTFDEFKGLTKEYCRNTEILLRKLNAKRMSVAIANEYVAKHLLKKMELKNRFEVLFKVSEDPMYVAFSKALGQKGKDLSEKFSQVLEQLKREGVIQKNIDKYLE